MKHEWSLALVLATCVVATSARADLFIRMDSIPGTSTSPQRKEWIDIMSFGVGVSRDFDPANPHGGSSPELTALRVVGPSTPSSPLIFSNVVSGQVMKDVRLEIVIPPTSGALQYAVAFWELTDALVTGYQTSVEEGPEGLTVTDQYDIVPTETLTYGFASYKIDATPLGSSEITWNLRKGTVTTATSGTVTNFQFLTGDIDPSELPTIGPISPDPVAGDFNSDGLVDAADYTVWRDTLSQTGTGLAADADRNDVVNAADYLIWRANAGAQPAAAAAVPEPASAVLATVAMAGIWLSHRRNSKSEAAARRV